jgi:hypothetical protein
MRWSSPKYGATRYAVIDIATRKNAFPGIQTKNSPDIIPIDCLGSFTHTDLAVRNLSSLIVPECCKIYKTLNCFLLISPLAVLFMYR